MGVMLSLDALKAYMSLSTTTDDDLLEDLIARSEASVRSYCSRHLTLAQFTESRNGHGGVIMQMRETPVLAVSAIAIDAIGIEASATSTARGYQFDFESVYLTGHVFTRGMRNVSITYQAGYKSDIVPYDLRQAVLEIAALSYRRRDHIDMATKAMAAESTTYLTHNMTPAARMILNKYMRVAPI